jgi:hypothetical protein
VKATTDADCGAGASQRPCLQQRAPTGTSNRLPAIAHLAGCQARRPPVHNDPIELLTVAAMAALAAAEIHYLARIPRTKTSTDLKPGRRPT